VGGTLWSERQWTSDHFAATRRSRLLAAGVPESRLEALFQLVDAASRDEMPVYLEVRSLLADCLARVGVSGVEPEAVRRAWSLPAVETVPLLPGASEVLAGIKELGLRCYVLSNAFVRVAVEYQEDFEAQGLAGYVDGYISSVDTLWRKPDRRIFEAALDLAGVLPERCVMIGNSEEKDVIPARALGMRTIRVAIEEELPETTAADVVTASLSEVPLLLAAAL